MCADILAVLTQNPLSTLVYACLAAALLTCRFCNQQKIWQIFFCLSLSLGLFSGRLLWLGMLWVLFLFTALYVYFQKPASKPVKVLSGVASVVLASLIAARVLPGFNNWKIANQLLLNPDAIPHSIWLNFDKPVIGLLVLALGISRASLQEAWCKHLTKILPISIAGIFITICTAIAMGYVRLEPRWTEIFWIWAPINLLFTCVGEEALFRGLIQSGFAKVLSKFSYGKWIALATASIAFGASHFAGGLSYVVLASLAGIFYGWVYMQSASLEFSVLTHFLLNSIHFLFFTYPALKGAAS